MASKIDLQGLIDEVLNMVRSRQAGGDSTSGWYGGNKDEEEYWKAMRLRNTELERQGLANTGALNVEQARSTGELARQKLISDTSTNVANIGLEGEKYKAERGVEAQRVHGSEAAQIALGQAGKDPVIATLHAAIAKDPDILSDKTRWAQAVENARMLNTKAPGTEDIRQFHRPAEPPTVTPTPAPTITNVSAPRPEGPAIAQVSSTTGPIRTPSPVRENLTQPMAPPSDRWAGLKAVGNALTWPLQAMTSTISPESVNQELTKRKKKLGEM